MRLPPLLTAAALLLSTSVIAADSAPRALDVRDLVQFDRVASPVLAPDGRQLAYTVRSYDLAANRALTRIWLRDSDGGGTARALTSDAFSAAAPSWSPDGESLYFTSARSGSQQVWALPLGGGEARQITRLPMDVGNYQLSPDGRSLALSLRVNPSCAATPLNCPAPAAPAPVGASGVLHEQLFVRHWDSWADGLRSQLYTLQLDEPGAEPVWVSRELDADVPSTPFGDFSELSWTPDSRQLVFSARIAGTTEAWSTNFDLYLAPADGSGPPHNLTADNPAWDTSPRLTPDGKQLIYLAMKRPGFEADRFALMSRPLAGGTARAIAPNWDRSPGSISLSTDGRTVYATADHLGQHPLFAIRVSDGQVRPLTGQGFVSGVAVGKREISLVKDDLANPAELFTIPLAGGAPRPLGAPHNQARLAALALSGYEPFSFSGHGGETVHGYLMKPAGFDPGRRYPVALVIHGGPQGSMGNHWHYRWNPQLLAAMGFGVVFIDFHGSTGYGQAFTDSISGDWGGKPLEDLQKGLAHALDANPWLDGSRACALGASYGGYMINWIAGNWPDGFDCLVNHDGIFDNRSMYYSTEELWFPEWEHGGPHYARPDAYEQHNPVHKADQWRTPMLVIHGALDYRVPLEQGLATFTALQRRGIPSRLLVFPDENHWVLAAPNSVQWYDTVKDWLLRWTAATP